jgi:hypothetical protein
MTFFSSVLANGKIPVPRLNPCEFCCGKHHIDSGWLCRSATQGTVQQDLARIRKCYEAVALDECHLSALFYGILGKGYEIIFGGLMFAHRDNPSKNADVASIGRAPHS